MNPAAARRPELPFATTQKLRNYVIDVANNEIGRVISHAFIKKYLLSEGHQFLEVHGFMRTMVDRKIFVHDKERRVYTLVMAREQARKLAAIQNMCKPRRRKAPENQLELSFSKPADKNEIKLVNKNKNDDYVQAKLKHIHHLLLVIFLFIAYIATLLTFYSVK